MCFGISTCLDSTHYGFGELEACPYLLRFLRGDSRISLIRSLTIILQSEGSNSIRASKDNSFRASRSVLFFELRLKVLYWIKTVSSFEFIDMGCRPERKKN